MQCKYELRKDLGCFVCKFCNHMTRDTSERVCTITEAQRLQIQRAAKQKKKTGGCGCGGGKKKSISAIKPTN
jgi:hypothetical protein